MKLRKPFQLPIQIMILISTDYICIMILIKLHFALTKKKMIIQFPIFIQPYMQQQLVLHQIDRVSVSIS